MFDRFNNTFLLACLLCLSLSLLSGCSKTARFTVEAIESPAGKDTEFLTLTFDKNTHLLQGDLTADAIKLSAGMSLNTLEKTAEFAYTLGIAVKADGETSQTVKIKRDDINPKPATVEVFKIAKPEVVIDSVGQDDVQIYLYTEGRTVASNSVEIRTRVSGFLEELFFRPGAIVKEGDRLAQVEKAAYDIALLAAKAELASNRARAALAEANLERTKILFERGSFQKEELQTAQANYDVALAAIELSNASIRNAELNLQYTDMRSPITGKTTKNLVDIGNFVSPTGAQAVLLSITQLDPMFVEFKLSDRQFTDLKERAGFRDAFNEAVGKSGEKSAEDTAERPLTFAGMPIDISLKTGVNVFKFDFNVPGKIVALVDNQISFATAQITVRAEIQNPLLNTGGVEDYMIYPGQDCRVRIPYEKIHHAVLIREEAILTDLDTKYVLLVKRAMYQPKDRFGNPEQDKDGNEKPPYETDIVERRDLKKLGRLLDTQMRIVEIGLEPGETYIVKGVQRVRIGTEVKPTTLEDYNARLAAEMNGK